MSTVTYPNLEVSSDGHLRIAGTGYKVIILTEYHRYKGWSAKELHENFPQLSLGQIHSALAYYYDHQAELDAEIDRREKLAEELRDQLEDPVLVQKLRAAKQAQGKPS